MKFKRNRIMINVNSLKSAYQEQTKYKKILIQSNYSETDSKQMKYI